MDSWLYTHLSSQSYSRTCTCSLTDCSWVDCEIVLTSWACIGWGHLIADGTTGMRITGIGHLRTTSKGHLLTDMCIIASVGEGHLSYSNKLAIQFTAWSHMHYLPEHHVYVMHKLNCMHCMSQDGCYAKEILCWLVYTNCCCLWCFMCMSAYLCGHMQSVCVCVCKLHIL